MTVSEYELHDVQTAGSDHKPPAYQPAAEPAAWIVAAAVALQLAALAAAAAHDVLTREVCAHLAQ